MADRSPAARRLYRAVAYPLQAGAALLVYGFFRLLPPDRASALGGRLGRAVGPRLGITRRAERNIRRALPALDDAAVAGILAEMWDNIGRVLGEYPHLERIAAERTEIAGENHLAPVRPDGVPCLFFSGHLANWELLPLIMRHVGAPFVLTYRAPNNPFVDALMRRVRRVGEADRLAKGSAGARGAIEVLKAGRRLGILADQKMNDGIAVPFFGRDAMTAPALARLALRYQCPVIPARLERTGGCRFRLTFFAPLAIAHTGDRARDVAAVMTEVNRMLEDWIGARPGQWLWLHRRWPDS